MKKTFGHKSGFRIPENYFEEFETRLFVEIKKETSKSKKIASGFKVPEGYFDNFEVSPQKETKLIPLFKNKKVWAYASSAAAIFILALLIFTPNTTQNLSFATLDEENLEMYFESGQIDFFNMESQILLLEDAVLGQTTFEGISDEAILDYLATQDELSFIDR